MPCATSPSAIACTSSGCMPQKSAIWVNVSAVFSISHTAVALGIRGSVMAQYFLVSLASRAADPVRRRAATTDLSKSLELRTYGPRVHHGSRRARLSVTPGMEKNMAIRDDAPPPKPVRVPKLPLDLLGVEELGDYIGELREEIARVEAKIGRKQHHRSAAEAFFRKP